MAVEDGSVEGKILTFLYVTKFMYHLTEKVAQVVYIKNPTYSFKIPIKPKAKIKIKQCLSKLFSC